MSDIDKVIDRVKKLLALAGNNNSAAEAATAAAMANSLLDEYRLSTADLESQDESTSEPIEDDVEPIYESGKVTAWKCLLIQVLCRQYGCSSWNDCDYSGRKISRYKLVGRKSDISVVRYMYAYLLSECTRLSLAEAKGMGRVFIASYCEGFVHGVKEQLKASRVEVEKQATSSAIVKIDARAEEAREAMYKMHNLKAVKGSSYRQRDGMAFNAGKVRGQNIHLGASIGSGGTKLLNG
jgi:hypothetical protein